MKIQLSDNSLHLNFAPLSLTRPIGDIRIGGLTNAERWKVLIPNAIISFETESYLSAKYTVDKGDIIVNACVLPNQSLAIAIQNLNNNEQLVLNGKWIAKCGTGDTNINYVGESIEFIEQRWEIFKKNNWAIKNDFEILTNNKTSVQLSSTNTIIGDPALVFMEAGAKVEASILNTTEGPIYLSKNAEIMEGSCVRGPFFMAESSAVKMGSKIYGPTTLGPHCKVGGEVNNSVFQGYSNKGHDGFIGNSVIGEWCNLGADTNCSNLKNNYGSVKTYSYTEKKQVQTDIQFMGLMMGDHSKCGINTMFNTASVVGVSSNVFGADFPAKFITDFSWGDNSTNFELEKAIESANNMMARRGEKLSQGEISIFKHLFEKK